MEAFDGNAQMRHKRISAFSGGEPGVVVRVSFNEHGGGEGCATRFDDYAKQHRLDGRSNCRRLDVLCLRCQPCVPIQAFAQTPARAQNRSFPVDSSQDSFRRVFRLGGASFKRYDWADNQTPTGSS